MFEDLHEGDPVRIDPLTARDPDDDPVQALVHHHSSGDSGWPRRRGADRADYVLETVCRDAGTARLLQRLIQCRTRGFFTHRRPRPGEVVSARAHLPGHRPGSPLLWPGPGTGWDLHGYRHSGLTHLGEQGTSG
ncbi:hypothetical protein GCM10014715_83240 [Streptomyces spiralis]|uniref:Uncharacterized protein n=1 Tax=Streptomyces spiralis TaxID=66376 RepID=A0A919AP13_9ACTN|nr:hypothetical protein GCM10014715_83240 [Streptomyces spiralis]